MGQVTLLGDKPKMYGVPRTPTVCESAEYNGQISESLPFKALGIFEVIFVTV